MGLNMATHQLRPPTDARIRRENRQGWKVSWVGTNHIPASLTLNPQVERIFNTVLPIRANVTKVGI